MTSLSTTKPLPLSSAKYDELSTMIRKSYKNACILWIEEVHCPDVNQRFEQRFQALVERERSLTTSSSPPVPQNHALSVQIPPTIQIKQLYHGTKEPNIKSICDQGWKIHLNQNSAFGKGSYFATEAKYSVNYTDVSKEDISYLLVADVIVGHTGVAGMSHVQINGAPIDTYVNNKINPTIYVARHDDDAIVRYVIAFHKKAPVQEQLLTRRNRVENQKMFVRT